MLMKYNLYNSLHYRHSVNHIEFNVEGVIRHLKLEIALAIPATNEWKIGKTNLAGVGLTLSVS